MCEWHLTPTKGIKRAFVETTGPRKHSRETRYFLCVKSASFGPNFCLLFTQIKSSEQAEQHASFIATTGHPLKAVKNKCERFFSSGVEFHSAPLSLRTILLFGNDNKSYKNLQTMYKWELWTQWYFCLRPSGKAHVDISSKVSTRKAHCME